MNQIEFAYISRAYRVASRVHINGRDSLHQGGSTQDKNIRACRRNPAEKIGELRIIRYAGRHDIGRSQLRILRNPSARLLCNPQIRENSMFRCVRIPPVMPHR
jgi:hypothetical protein